MLTDDELSVLGLVPIVIARGRTLRGPVHGSGKPDPDNPHRVIGTLSRTYHPGEVVWIEAHDVERLRGLGFVLDPSNPADAEAVNALRAPPPLPDAPIYISAQAADAPRAIRIEK
ncbi:hypothetical protein [Paraburkholderia sp. BR10954]|uniref:hypothetical protein n=1 Tax=Paraburkholderia sp. BR10954 TaxID=3236995 RepID=UPI0034D268DC